MLEMRISRVEVTQLFKCQTDSCPGLFTDQGPGAYQCDFCESKFRTAPRLKLKWYWRESQRAGGWTSWAGPFSSKEGAMDAGGVEEEED